MVFILMYYNSAQSRMTIIRIPSMSKIRNKMPKAKWNLAKFRIPCVDDIDCDETIWTELGSVGTNDFCSNLFLISSTLCNRFASAFRSSVPYPACPSPADDRKCVVLCTLLSLCSDSTKLTDLWWTSNGAGAKPISGGDPGLGSSNAGVVICFSCTGAVRCTGVYRCTGGVGVGVSVCLPGVLKLGLTGL